MLFSYHTHSEYCDGRVSARKMAETAAQAGYSILGFSSHAPLPFETDWNMKWDQLESYCTTISSLASEWENKNLVILTGLEVDFISGLVSPADAAYSRTDIDYRIGSVHYITGLPGGVFTVDEPKDEFETHLKTATGGDAKPMWKEYYHTMIAMIEHGGFDIIGHFDIVKKNNENECWFDEEDPAYIDAAFEAVDAAGKAGCIAEINTGGIARGKISTTYPSKTILSRMQRSGVRLTLGDDAHDPSHLARYQRLALDAALAAGYKSIWYLDKERAWKELGI
jgi:histidinol-phosphatase (PHP family)